MLKRLLILTMLMPLVSCGDNGTNNNDKKMKQQQDHSLLLGSNAFVSTCTAGRMEPAVAKTLSDLYALTTTLVSSEGCAVLYGRMLKLTSLKLNPTGLTDIGFIADLTNLTSLDISGNKVTSLAPLKTMDKLTELNASDNRIKDLNPIGAAKKLTKLYVANNPDIDPKSLQALPKTMDELDLSGIKLGKVSALPALNVILLRLKNNGLTDLSGLRVAFGNGPGIIDVSNNDVGDLSPLAGLPSLSTILAVGTSAEAKGCPALKSCTFRQ